MNLSETARLLAMIAAFNNRTIGEGDVIAWQSVLADIPLADGEEAVRRHFAEQTEWMMPAHVRRLAGDVQRERAVAATPWAPGQYGVPKEQAVPELARGAGRLTAEDVSPDVLDLLSQLRASLPDVPRERLFPRQVQWERQHRAFVRQMTAEPVRPDVLGEARDRCRANGPHDSGAHIDICPDIEVQYDPGPTVLGPNGWPVPADEPHQHRASCDGSIGEHLCGFP